MNITYIIFISYFVILCIHFGIRYKGDYFLKQINTKFPSYHYWEWNDYRTGSFILAFLPILQIFYLYYGLKYMFKFRNKYHTLYPEKYVDWTTIAIQLLPVAAILTVWLV